MKNPSQRKTTSTGAVSAQGGGEPATVRPTPVPATASLPTEIEVCNPRTGIPVGTVPVHDGAHVAKIVSEAREAQATWSQTPLKLRCELARRFLDRLVDQREAVTATVQSETAKPEAEILSSEIFPIADLTAYFSKNAPRILKDQKIGMHLLKHRASYIKFLPEGVVGVIGPWNYPLLNCVAEPIMALIAGNAVVLKPSEYTPFSSLHIARLWHEVGLDPRLFQVVTGYGATGAALIGSGIQHVIFTGSVETGRKVAEAAGRNLIKCTLELGGKDPMIVRADADLDRAAQAMVWGAFSNNGQVCASVERAYVHADVYNALVDKVVNLTRELRFGPDCNPSQMDVGPFIDPRQVEVVKRHVEAAVQGGARILCGGNAIQKEGRFWFEPTVLVDVQQNMAVMQEETFGPVLPIVRVSSDKEALDMANDSVFGLSSYVFTKDTDDGLDLADQIESGSTVLNDVLITAALPEAPWGGIKHSGIGHVHSDDGLRELCRKKYVNYNRIGLPKKELWWYPYGGKTVGTALKLFGVLFEKGLAQKVNAVRGKAKGSR